MKQLFIKNGKYFFFFFVFIQFSYSCNTIDSQVPDVSFSFTINLNIYNDLKIPGNSVYFPGVGFGGVIISCETFDSYYAYDATCTNELSQNCVLKNDGVLGTCPCCKSQYVLYYAAYPSSGPAVAPLKQYNISNVNSFTLRVYN
jgi:Rieske Fe-S protein